MSYRIKSLDVCIISNAQDYELVTSDHSSKMLIQLDDFSNVKLCRSFCRLRNCTQEPGIVSFKCSWIAWSVWLNNGRSKCVLIVQCFSSTMRFRVNYVHVYQYIIQISWNSRYLQKNFCCDNEDVYLITCILIIKSTLSVYISSIRT